MSPADALAEAEALFRAGALAEARRLAEDAAARSQGGATRLLAAIGEAEGRLDEADRLFALAADADPSDVSALDGLIRVSHRRGDLRRLTQALSARLRLAPGDGNLWSDLGAALERLGQRSDAETAYRRGAVVFPASPHAMLNRAALAYHLGNDGLALQLAYRARAIGGRDGEAWLIAGHADQRRGGGPSAALAYRRALASLPANASAWQGVAALSMAGKEGRRALLFLRRAADLDPGDPGTMANLAEGHRDGGDLIRAFRLVRGAVALAPSSVVGHNTLALASSDLAEDTVALRWARRAIVLAPDRADLLVNLGVALKALGQFKTAEAAIREGLKRRPEVPSSHMSLATTLLAVGKVKEGLSEYEWRHAEGPTRYDIFPAKRWDGRRLASGKLLVWGEQGIGDEIMFAQYLARACGRTSRVIVECEPRLVSIFERSFPGIEFVARTMPPSPRLLSEEVEAQIALCSLPWALGLDETTINSAGPYLTPDPARRERLANRLADLGQGLRVGFAWRSIRETAVTARVHAPLAHWRPVLQAPGITFVNLQYGDCEADLGFVESAFGVRVHRFPELDLFKDIDAVMALGANVDLIVSSATSACIPPAAAGVETWLLLTRIDFFTFGAGAYPMLPNCRGFVRDPDVSWSPAIAGIAQALDLRRRRHPERRR
ncbi:MAG: tetratricopeptide repeat protein [Alphaproteobacteria bacterium]|nr:tetratricopeptide repeat protein [Alphaproteobacteria bacterium]